MENECVYELFDSKDTISDQLNYNGYDEVKTLFDKIRVQTAENVLLKYVKT